MHDELAVSPEFKNVTRDQVRALPKVVLHDHLDGGLRPETYLDLARDAGYTGIDATSPAEVNEWFRRNSRSESLSQYLECFDHTVAVMQTAEAIERVAQEAVEDLAADGCVYAEIRCAPELHTRQGLSMDDVVDAIIAGFEAGEKSAARQGHDITVRLLVCALRQSMRVEEAARLAVRRYKPGDVESRVVGFDIAGPEDGFAASIHSRAFELLRHNLVPVTVHAGEAAGIESIRDALSMGALRLGHGIRVVDDFGVDIDGIRVGRVSNWVRERRIALEMCVSSNLQTSACDDLADHPFPLLHSMGFACTINPDNRLVSGVTMTDEMMLLAEHYDYGFPEFYDLTSTALSSAFAPLELREQIAASVIEPAYRVLMDQELQGRELQDKGIQDKGRGNEDGPAQTGRASSGAKESGDFDRIDPALVDPDLLGSEFLDSEPLRITGVGLGLDDDEHDGDDREN